MKGVIVQVSEPKSIVLLNNGRIIAMPTPANCHVGMVVTVKYSNLLKMTLITLAAVLLITLGIFIGAAFFGRSEASSDTDSWEDGHMRRHMRMMEQR